jgi:hypothetical protein
VLSRGAGEDRAVARRLSPSALSPNRCEGIQPHSLLADRHAKLPLPMFPGTGTERRAMETISQVTAVGAAAECAREAAAAAARRREAARRRQEAAERRKTDTDRRLAASRARLAISDQRLKASATSLAASRVLLDQLRMPADPAVRAVAMPVAASYQMPHRSPPRSTDDGRRERRAGPGRALWPRLGSRTRERSAADARAVCAG